MCTPHHLTDAVFTRNGHASICFTNHTDPPAFSVSPTVVLQSFDHAGFSHTATKAYTTQRHEGPPSMVLRVVPFRTGNVRRGQVCNKFLSPRDKGAAFSPLSISTAPFEDHTLPCKNCLRASLFFARTTTPRDLIREKREGKLLEGCTDLSIFETLSKCHPI